MRILYLGSTDFPQPKARAIQIVNTAHALARAGADVTLVVGRRGRASVERALATFGLSPHPRLRIVRVPIARIPPSAPPPVLAWFTRVWQASYLLGLATSAPLVLGRGRPDVVYARDFRTARLAATPVRQIGARLGFEVHGLPSFEARHRAGRSGLSPAHAERLQRLELAVFERADRIVTITEAARRILIRDFGLPPERVRTIPDAAPAPNSPPRDDRQVEPGPRNGRELPAVYYVGQLYPWKGAGLVVEAAARTAAARFVIVGGLPNGARGDPDVVALAGRAECLGVADRVELRGYVPYARVREVLRDASIAVLPLPNEPVARYFTSPLKLFDYLAAGLPIVASDLPSVREVLRDGENALLVPPDDPAVLAAAIDRLLADRDLARRIGEQARQDAAAHTWDARARRLLAFLEAGHGHG